MNNQPQNNPPSTHPASAPAVTAAWEVIRDLAKFARIPNEGRSQFAAGAPPDVLTSLAMSVVGLLQASRVGLEADALAVILDYQRERDLEKARQGWFPGSGRARPADRNKSLPTISFKDLGYATAIIENKSFEFHHALRVREVAQALRDLGYYHLEIKPAPAGVSMP